MSLRTRLARLTGLCLVSMACVATDARYFGRMESKSHNLVNQQRWAEVLHISQTALARCDRIDWCSKDRGFQGAFHNYIGNAEEHLGHRELALEHYRKAFYAYPLYFSTDYFQLLREMGLLRLLRREIDVKLASEGSANVSAAPAGVATSPTCAGRSVAGSYSWRLRMTSGGGGTASGRAEVSQSGCVVSADLTSKDEQTVGRNLHLRGDVGTGVATLLYGPPCTSADRGQLGLEKNGFTVNAVRATVVEGCINGAYEMAFVRE